MSCLDGEVVFIHLKQLDKTDPSTLINEPGVAGLFYKQPRH